MKKRILTLVFAFALIISELPAAALDVTSASAIVVDVNSGNTYYEKNADTPLAPASMTKVMTVYLIYENIGSGKLSKETLITADEEDQDASLDPEASNVYLEAGRQYSVDELIGAILLPSACAASAMVGKYIAGSEAEFAALMTRTAERLGLTAYFEDASGLSNNNRITARSMARLVSIMLTEYPDVLTYTSKSCISFGGRTYRSTNAMLSEGSMPYEGVDGFKTGTTALAGYCFAATALRGDARLVSVTMHSESGAARFEDTGKMLDFGFSEAEARYNSLYPTEFKVYINGFEIPAFYYKGRSNHIAILAEDLAHYGFKIDWDDKAKLLTVRYDAYKDFDPIGKAESYLRFGAEQPILSTYELGSSVELIYKDEVYTMNNIHDLSGYIAISADELSEMAKVRLWDNDTESLYMHF